MIDYRHVCFKDLNNYFKKDDYLGNLTYSEQSRIRSNIGAMSQEEFERARAGLVEDTYENIKEIADKRNLSLNCTYIVNDFQTMYLLDGKCEYGEVYKVVLKAISNNQFDRRVSLMKQNEEEQWIGLDWIVNYDFDSEVLCEDSDGNNICTKGKITYLQDSHNNSAFYDFKNIRFLKEIPVQNAAGRSSTIKCNLYTFSKIENTNSGFNIIENSDDNDVYNNQFDWDCYDNVFLGTTNNNHFGGKSRNNIFLSNCQYNNFDWNTANNVFCCQVRYTKGSVQNAMMPENFEYSGYAVSKEFSMVGNQDNSLEPKFVVSTIDGDTLTYQIYSLKND